MSSTTTAAAAAPEPKVEAGAVEILEEDDEFEEFEDGGWDAQGGADDGKLWQDDWDDDDVNDDFTQQLRQQIDSSAN